YRDKYPIWKDEQLFTQNSQCAQQIENTLQKHTTADIINIPPEKISSLLVELAQFEISTS
ncbi:MAG: hypothetical protein ABII10_00410, partial [Candidatus Paceibacterota bacterium]